MARCGFRRKDETTARQHPATVSHAITLLRDRRAEQAKLQTRAVEMIDHLLRGTRLLVSTLRVMAGVLLGVSVLLNFINVVARYFFNESIYWAEEVMLFLMVGCVFFGNGVVAWSGRQLRMDVLVGMTPKPVQKALFLASELVLIAVCLAIAVFSWPVIRDLALFDQRSQSAEIPMVIPQALVPIGLALMAFLVIARLITGGDPAPNDDAHH
jgi:TRAP-type C4-dicarboxylate transport system permease small subunit